MGEMQDLIHATTMSAYERGIVAGQQRAIKALETLRNFEPDTPRRLEHLVALEVMLRKVKEELVKEDK